MHFLRLLCDLLVLNSSTALQCNQVFPPRVYFVACSQVTLPQQYFSHILFSKFHDATVSLKLSSLSFENCYVFRNLHTSMKYNKNKTNQPTTQPKKRSQSEAPTHFPKTHGLRYLLGCKEKL